MLTTQWTDIEQLHGDVAPEAWRWFIDRYRGFVDMVLRRLIWSRDRAMQASEEFWGYLFASGALARVGRQMRFRGFLVNTLRHYALDWLRRNPQLDAPPASEREELRTTLSEDEEIALWARQLLHLALQRLATEQPKWVELLRAVYGLPPIVDAAPVPPRRATEVAARLGCKPNALHQIMYRARERLRDLLVAEVRQTVSGRRDLDAELEVLLAAIGCATPGILPATTESKP